MAGGAARSTTVAETLRYRAPTRITYSLALIALVEYGREHSDPDFEFGPLDLERLETEGLHISGTSLEGVSDVLARVPGLVEVPA